MKRTSKDVLRLTLIGILIAMTGCEDKSDTALPSEDTTQLVRTVTQTKKDSSDEWSSAQEDGVEKPTPQPFISQSFTLQGVRGKQHTIAINEGNISLESAQKPLVIISFFDPHSKDALAQVPYFTKLQKKHQEILAVLGIPIDKTLDEEDLRSWVETHHAEYFVSVGKSNLELLKKISQQLQIATPAIPLTLLYKDGVNYNHYEGVVPIEMIAHDIETANKP